MFILSLVPTWVGSACRAHLSLGHCALFPVLRYKSWTGPPCTGQDSTTLHNWASLNSRTRIVALESSFGLSKVLSWILSSDTRLGCPQLTIGHLVRTVLSKIVHCLNFVQGCCFQTDSGLPGCTSRVSPGIFELISLVSSQW